MRVKATRLGYYNHERRREGEVFDLAPIHAKDKDGKDFVVSPEKQFSENWMEKVDGETPQYRPPRPVPGLSTPGSGPKPGSQAKGKKRDGTSALSEKSGDVI